jgi:hypothetical protein
MYFMPHNEKDEWHKRTYPDAFYGYNLDKIFEREVRVKTLSRECIESLGWKVEDYDTYKIEHHGTKFTTEWFITFDPEYYIFITKKKCERTETIFKGKIKNKSELIKIMEQLNIK